MLVLLYKYEGNMIQEVVISTPSPIYQLDYSYTKVELKFPIKLCSNLFTTESNSLIERNQRMIKDNWAAHYI